MIVIKGNKTSEFYADYCTKSWTDIGLNVIRFDAITPDKLEEMSKYKHKWDKYVNRLNYIRRNLKIEISETEKSCFYSHYLLWEKCVRRNQPILVLEHDSYLEYPENIWIDFKYGMIFYDKAAMGSYIIFPWFAKEILKFLKKIHIDRGPYSLLYAFAHKYGLLEYFVNDKHLKYKVASNQVMSEEYGNTIEHNQVKFISSDDIPSHEFKKI